VSSELIAQFNAIIPDITAALKVSGEGAGRLTLDMDETQLPEVLKAVALGKGRLLTVMIYAE
jgi:hypothetical protein